MTVRAVAFDLDDTLAVPGRDRATILATALERAGVTDRSGLTREDYLAAHDRNAASETREAIFADALERADADADPGDAAAAYREEIADALRPVDGAAEMLDDLGERYALGVLTDGPGLAQRDKLRALGWTDRFDAVVVTGDLETRKPDPVAFDALLDELGTPADATAYVGDHVERDVAGAGDAGLRPVQVLGPDDEPSPRAAAHVRRERLPVALPDVLATLD